MIIQKIYSRNAGTISANGNLFNFNRPNEQRKDDPGTPFMIVPHWTVADRDSLFDDYHFNITQIKDQVYVFQTLSWSEKGQHLWQRNTGAVGISLCGMSNENNKPSAYMADTMAILCAEICAWKHIDPFKKIELPKKKYISQDHRMILQNVPGEVIQIDPISDHAVFGVKDGYGNPDIGPYYKIVLESALEYYKELKANKRQFIFKELL